MKTTRVTLRAYDNRAEFSAFVAIMMVGILAKFDAAALLFYTGVELGRPPKGVARQSEAVQRLSQSL
jgi:hypothetical protein